MLLSCLINGIRHFEEQEKYYSVFIFKSELWNTKTEKIWKLNLLVCLFTCLLSRQTLAKVFNTLHIESKSSMANWIGVLQNLQNKEERKEGILIP